MSSTDTPAESALRARRLGLWGAPALAITLMLLEPPGAMPAAAWLVLAVTLWMALWWLTEAIPISATALLPLALFPLLGVAPLEAVAAPYANPLIFLFLGGFLLALAMQRWQLHRRIALFILHYAGRRPHQLVAGFMLATAFLSMWVSNTATAAMMLPIGLSVIHLVGQCREEVCDAGEDRFAIALLLGIAFAANIGGMATLIGTPPNALLAGFLRERYELEVGFGQWMLLGLPVASVLLVLSWLALTRWLFPLERVEVPGIGAMLARRRAELGPLSVAERRVAIVFVLTALAWMGRPWLQALVPGLQLSDPGIAVLAGLLLFLIPAERGGALLEWSSTRELPWGVLLLVGGGLSLGTAIEASGFSGWLAQAMGALEAWPLAAVVLAIAAVVMLASHVTSNTATAATFIPLATALAVSFGETPLLLALPVAMAASCAFMLPVATPPNAIVFASGKLAVADMARAGIWLSALALALVTAATLWLAPWVFGLSG